MPTLNRRQFIRLSGSAAAVAVLAGCNPNNFIQPYPQVDAWPTIAPNSTWRALNRITFGPRPAERTRAEKIGLTEFIEEQLAPDTLPKMDTGPQLKIRRLESLKLDTSAIFDVEREAAMLELQQATLLRAVYSPRQLTEVMVNFWSDHFNISQLKNNCAWLKTIDDREVIRPHALGNFHDLLYASAHSPAMLMYLDNQENMVGNPNENYARELLELHTLGVDGGYTQGDIQELARCLTGWTVKEHFYHGEYTFDADIHDNGPKHILSLSIPAGALQAGGEHILEMLATHPATARFIAAKLARRFVADDPPPQLVERAAQTLLDTQGEIKAVLRTILLSPEMLNADSDAPLKLKRPFEFVVSALRQLNAQTDGGVAIQQYLSEMGQPLFQWPTPDGFPDRAEAWNGTLLTRWRFALALANDNLPGTQLDLNTLIDTANSHTAREHLRQFAILLLGQPLPTEVVSQLLQDNPQDKTLLTALLASPAFQWR